MSTVAASQQSDWSTNIYTLTITRILLVLGTTYLIRSIVTYFFQTLPSATRVPSIDVEAISHEDFDVAADILSITSLGPNIRVDANLDLELDLRPPQRSYNPRDRQQRSHADGREDPLASAISPSTNGAIGALDQDTTVRNGRTPNNEGSAEASVTRNSSS